MIYPPPKHQNISGWISLPPGARVCILHNGFGNLQAPESILKSALGGDEIQLSIQKEKPDFSENQEAFTLKTAENQGKMQIFLNCLTESALVHGLFFIKKLLDKNRLFTGSVTDYPMFSRRGCIEGFYGKPWSHEQRLEMIEFMASKGENCLYYAPKDDPYHRRLWREPYPKNRLLQLKELAEKARSYSMSFTYCLAPGLSIRYTHEGDFSAVCGKIYSLYNIGVKNFGLLFDDIPQGFSCGADEEAFPDFAHAHACLTNRVYRYIKSLDEACTLTVCPTVYWGKGDGDYERHFGRSIPEDVMLFFTGRDICSREITCDQAVYIRENTGHKPLYWDNFPVNDAEMFKEMHMAPVKGRETGLYGECEGLISNCMEYFNCTKIPLSTVADYLWSPVDYDPEKSFEAAVKELVPKDEIQAFTLLSDHLRTSCLRDENSRIMGQYLCKATADISNGEISKAIPPVREYTKMTEEARRVIQNSTSPIFCELKEWSEKFFLMTEIMRDSLSLLESPPKAGEKLKNIIKKKMDVYNNLATVLTAFCFREYIETLLECV